jgi:hypothetical protein
MNRRSLVSLKLKNGSTDLNIFFFILFALIQGWFKKKKNRKSCPENWKIREKLKVLFSVGTAGTIWLIKKNWKSYSENWKIWEKLKVLFCDGYA